MAKRTKTDQAKLALRRVTEDAEVQAQLRTAAIRFREAGARVARRPGTKAVEDKKLYTKLREAITALRQAILSLGRPPEPPKHHGRKVVLVMAGAGGTAYVLKKKRSSENGAAAEPAPTGTTG
jgi:hypothetical protein